MENCYNQAVLKVFEVKILSFLKDYLELATAAFSKKYSGIYQLIGDDTSLANS